MQQYWQNRHRFHQHTKASLLLSGKPYFSRLHTLIAQAKHSIHLQFYIFDEDSTGSEVIEALIQARQRGVNVYVIVDGYASNNISKQTIQQLRNSDVYFKRFSPIKSFYLRIGRRMHHKIVLIDDQIALIGGLNIADKYAGVNEPHPWLDFAVEVKGSVVTDIKKMVDSYLPKNFRKSFNKRNIETEQIGETSSAIAMPIGQCRLLQNDWRRGYIEISASYRQAIREANQELIIVASYFFPNNSILRLIKKARQRGVRVVFLTGSSSDVVILGAAVKYLYDWMLRNGIEIYEWQPNVMHGKILLRDGSEVNIGSYNLNALSDFGSTEANIQIIDTAFAAHTKQILWYELGQNSKRIDKTYFTSTITWWMRLYRWFSYHVFRTSLKLLFVVMQRSRFKAA